MITMLYLIGGWLGLLLRSAVFAQLVVVVLLAVVHRGWRLRRRLPRTSWWLVGGKLGLIAALGLSQLVFLLLGWPSGLILLMLQLVSIWTSLDALRLLLRRSQDPVAVEGFFQRAVKPLFLLLGLLVILSRLDAVSVLAGIPLLQIFGQELTVGDLLLLLSLPYFLVVLSELPVVLLGMMMQRLLEMTPGNRKAFELILRYMLIALGVLWLFNRIGLNGTAIAAIAGGLSVGLGFGIKEVFSNFVSGLWLLFEGSVRPGEVLFIDGDPCEVRRLGLRAATLWRDRDNAELVIPNQTFFTSATTTYTGSDCLRRSQVSVGAGYQHEPERVMQLLEDTALAHPEVLQTPRPVALLTSYEDSCILYVLRFWIDHPMKNGAVCSQVNLAIWHAFRQHGIEMPFPQRVVHQAATPVSPAEPG